MHLFEAIIDANHRAVAGDTTAGLHPAEIADAPLDPPPLQPWKKST
jgi:hypothetical protein